MYSLENLPFIDLYVPLEGTDLPLYRSREPGKSRINQIVPEPFVPAAREFAAFIHNALHDNDGSVGYQNFRVRVARQHMADGNLWICARRINMALPELDKLGIAPHIVEHMRGLGQREGLIVLSGATGQGKTTTAVALLADYLKRLGGTAVTIEDPIEYLLKGRHGENGHCFQMEAHTDDDWATCLKRSLRWAPRFIFVGEIRTPRAAEQLLRAATTGQTVITTVHAGSPEEALMGLQFLAEQAMGPGASTVLAASLTALTYQTMRDTGPFIRYLFTEENAAGDPIRTLIREGKIGMLGTYIERISARLTSQSGPQTVPPPPPASALPSLKKPN